MAEFDKDGEWHKARCPGRRDLGGVCFGRVRWAWDSPYGNYGPRHEFAGKTCVEVFAEEERRAAAAPEEWRVVTEGVTQYGDRCRTHPSREMLVGVPVAEGIEDGCVIERRVAAEPAAAPEAAPADAPAEQVVGVKAWSLTLDRAADAADATGFAMLAVKQPDWIPYKPTPDAARDLWEALDPQYAEDAALGRLMRTVQERWNYVEVNKTLVAVGYHDELVADHGDFHRKALAFAAGRAVLATPHVPQYVADAALAEREARVAEARAGLAVAREMNAEGGAK